MPETTSRSCTEAERLVALDWIKAVGIACFILWHAIDYFFTADIADTRIGRSIFFTTGLFVFSAGFMVGFHYVPRMENPAFAASTRWRLVTRGAKLLGIFLCAKAASMAIEGGVPAARDLLQGAADVASLFYVDRWDQPLQVLAVISLVLIVTPFCHFLTRTPWRRVALIALIIGGTGELLTDSHVPYLWRNFAVGVVGMVFGRRVYQSRPFPVRTLHMLVWISLPVLAGLSVTAAASIGVYHVLLRTTLPNLLSVVAVFLALGIPVHMRFSVHGEVPSRTFRYLCLTGEMSLYVYLLQIVLIRLLSATRAVVRSEDLSRSLAMALAIWAVCALACITTRSLRKFSPVARLYRAIFS